MDQNRSDSILDQVVQALEDEKAQLQGKLEAEIDVSERQKYESRLAEINADLEINKARLQESSLQVEQEVRRSERERRPTEKMLELRRDEIAKKERKFMFTYLNFKAEVQFIRSKLKEECSKTLLNYMMVTAEKHEAELKQIYENIRALNVPSQDI